MTDSPERDRALSVLVALAEFSSFSVSITLTTVGGVVTGTLVSGTEWVRLNIETLKAAGADNTGLVSFYETFAEKFTREATETAAVQDAVSEPFQGGRRSGDDRAVTGGEERAGLPSS
ncbi:hypothetical protein [Kitasatospora griseola]|uniref:hypothetical protein n=1 Tax=Kitasatospora griseola TaxID=2064 RepID=UPI0037FD9B8E